MLSNQKLHFLCVLSIRNKLIDNKKDRIMKKFTIFAILLCIAGIVAAQSAVVSVGGDAQGNGGSVSYTVGQVAVQTVANSNGSVSVAEGVQQPS